MQFFKQLKIKVYLKIMWFLNKDSTQNIKLILIGPDGGRKVNM